MGASGPARGPQGLDPHGGVCEGQDLEPIAENALGCGLMSGYTPVFDSVFNGTLCGKWPTLPVWLTILPMADKNGVIDMTPQAMSAVTGWPLDLLKQAIDELCAPDPESRSDEHEGRRLELIDSHRSWGWRVVNHGKYKEKARKLSYDTERTASGKDAERKKAERAAKSREVPRSPDAPRDIPLSDADTDTDLNPKNPSAASPPGKRVVPRGNDPDWFLDFKLAYPERAGDQGWRRALRAANARIAEGHTAAELIAGAKRYAAFVDATGKRATEFVKQAATFLGPDKPFLLPWKPPPKPETDTERLLRLNSTHDDRVIEHEPETPALLVQH